MKKIVLSIAAVMAAAAFAPEASAVPVFARQTGMACSACHFQHFPLLNGFGRAFKASGFTMMGAQGKVEGEHLSIPNTLNMAVLATAGVEKASNASSNTFVPGTGGELQLFFGGKVTEFAGFLSEFATAPAGAAAAKLTIMPEITDGVRAGFTVYSSGQGAAYVMEYLNTGATSIHRLMGKAGPQRQHINVTSARQYVAPEAGGTGLSVNVAASNYMFAVAKETNVGPGLAGGTQGVGLPYQYVRAVGLFDLAGWDAGVGIQSFSGTGVNAANAVAVPAVAPGVLNSQKATIIDGQLQGEMAGMPVGIYASYGTAPASVAGGIANAYNAGANTKSSFNIAAEFGVLPGKATLQVAMRSGNNGGVVAGTNLTDNAVMVGATYELAQNMGLSLHYTAQSGSFWSTQVAPVGQNATTLLLETLF